MEHVEEQVRIDRGCVRLGLFQHAVNKRQIRVVRCEEARRVCDPDRLEFLTKLGTRADRGAPLTGNH